MITAYNINVNLAPNSFEYISSNYSYTNNGNIYLTPLATGIRIEKKCLVIVFARFSISKTSVGRIAVGAKHYLSSPSDPNAINTYYAGATSQYFEYYHFRLLEISEKYIIRPLAQGENANCNSCDLSIVVLKEL